MYCPCLSGLKFVSMKRAEATRLNSGSLRQNSVITNCMKSTRIQTKQHTVCISVTEGHEILKIVTISLFIYITHSWS
jgi:hypothetical protein